MYRKEEELVITQTLPLFTLLLFYFRGFCDKTFGYVDENLFDFAGSIYNSDGIFYGVLVELASKPWKSADKCRKLRFLEQLFLDISLGFFLNSFNFGKLTTLEITQILGNVDNLSLFCNFRGHQIFLARSIIFSIQKNKWIMARRIFNCPIFRRNSLPARCRNRLF